jgi:hypothetical protein
LVAEATAGVTLTGAPQLTDDISLLSNWLLPTADGTAAGAAAASASTAGDAGGVAATLAAAAAAMLAAE